MEALPRSLGVERRHARRVLTIMLFLSMLLVVPLCAAPELSGELVFTIPWGDKWGTLKFISEAELSEAMYTGPSAMAVTPTGQVYIYDEWTRRLQRFNAQGALMGGAQFDRKVPGITFIALGRQRPDGSQPIVLVSDNNRYIGRLSQLPEKPGPASPSQLLKGSIAPGTMIYRVGVLNFASLFVEEGGMSEALSYIRQFDGDSYRQRYEAVDLVPWGPWYYALASDRTATKLYQPAEGQLTVLQIDGGEGGVTKEITIAAPPLEDKRLRWHLIGAGGGRGAEQVFFLAKHWPVWADDEIYAVFGDSILGYAKVAVPGVEEKDRYLELWTHFACVADNGNLYLGIPSKKGFAVVRYKAPTIPLN